MNAATDPTSAEAAQVPETESAPGEAAPEALEAVGAPVEDSILNERPVLRPFGAVQEKVQSAKANKPLLMAGALLVALALGYTLLPAATSPTAPEADALLTQPPGQQGAETTLAAPVVAVAAAEARAQELQAVAEAKAEAGANANAAAVQATVVPDSFPVIKLESFLDGSAPEPASLAEALDQIKQLRAMLQKPAPAPKEHSKPARKVASKPAPQVEYVSVMVLDISQDRVLVADASRPDIKIAVAPGARLPGGATYIGFDPHARLMKTDQGDFPIP